MKIEIKNVTKKIDKEMVLNDISLSLNSGTIYGLVGRNGSGKSMLLKTICGFVKPDKGYVIVNGEDIYKNNTFPKNTAALIERPNFQTLLALVNNLVFLLKLLYF